MLHIDSIRAASEELISVALVGDEWDVGLSRLSTAVGAQGAALMRNRGHKVVGVIASPEIREPVADFMAGRIPAPSRQVRATLPTRAGFKFDYDDYTADELAKDPYYQEFLLPWGYFWHAAVGLWTELNDEIALSFKREFKYGPYEKGDAGVLNTALPNLRAALHIGRRLWDAQIDFGFRRSLHDRGDPVFELDSFGYVLRTNVLAQNTARPVRTLARRLFSPEPGAQAKIERAILTAVGRPGAPAIVALQDTRNDLYSLLIVPVHGQARDIFHATAAIAVLMPRRRDRQGLTIRDEAIRSAFDLTERELMVAALLVDGIAMGDIAVRLRIRVGTARDHLKSVFHKTSTSRQAELVALFAHLSI